MRLRALLVYPEMPPTYWSMKYALPFLGKKATIPPLGLLTVAALLPEEYEVRLVDMNVEPLTEAAVAAADLVLTSSMLVQKDSLEKVIALSRRLGKKVVAGGPYPTSCHERIEGVDHFVLNEAETTLPRFLADLEKGRPERVYADATKPDITRSPAPRFDLIRRKRYSTMALQFSRGCPHTCEFCDIIEIFGRTPRTKTPGQFLNELTLLHEAGGRGSLFVVDDNFIGNVREVKKLLPELAAWQEERSFPFAFFTEATLRLAEDEELMGQMVQAGFNMVFAGVETPDRKTLESAGKTANLRGDLLSSVRRIQAHGLEVSAGFIVGFDTDSEDIFDRQIRFIQGSGIPAAMVSLLTALPRTQLYRRLQKEGRLTGESSGGNNTHDLRLNFVPRMDLAKLIAGYKRVLSEIYKPDRYFDRCLDLLRSMKPHRASARRVTFTELRAFVLSFALQSFSPYFWAYWKFLIRGFLARPRMIGESVTMAVKGHHFFKMTRNVLEVDRFNRLLEDLARSFGERARSVPASGIREKGAELRAQRDRLLAGVQARYRKLHKDFRVYAEDALAEFRRSTADLVARLESGELPVKVLPTSG